MESLFTLTVKSARYTKFQIYSTLQQAIRKVILYTTLYQNKMMAQNAFVTERIDRPKGRD